MSALSASATGTFSATPTPAAWSAEGSLVIEPSHGGTLNGSGTLTIAGFAVKTYGVGLQFFQRYLGEQGVPQDISRLRGQVYDAMRRFGQPIIVKHMFNAQDERMGIAMKSPLWKDAYGQVRKDDPFSYGVGYCSRLLSENEWIAPDGNIVLSNTQPSPQHIQAPKYRGYGPGYLIFVVEPNAREDIFKLTEVGAMIRTQDAMIQAPWYPEIHDNDLIVNVVLDNNSNVIDVKERYQAQQVLPVGVHGEPDKRGRPELNTQGRGARWVVNQQFMATKVPFSNTNPVYRVELDR